MTFRAYRRSWINGRRYLHNPQCYACDQGVLLDNDGHACGCGLPYEEAPAAWRAADERRAATVIGTVDTHYRKGYNSSQQQGTTPEGRTPR